MIIGVISDAHGNIYGLEQCVSLLQRFHAEKIFFLGDAVNYFGKGREAVAFLKENRISCIKGNHENTLLTNEDLTQKQKEIYGIDHTRATLQEDEYAFIRTWGDTIEVTASDYKILMVHGSPRDYLRGYIYPDSDLAAFSDLPHNMIFVGHTHIPFIRTLDDKIIVNVGSVGFRRDDGRYLSCALLDTDERKIRILKDRFPLEKLADLEPFSPLIRDVLDRRTEFTVEDTYENR